MRGLVAFIPGFIFAAMVGSIVAHAQTIQVPEAVPHYVPHSQAQHDKYGGIRNRKGQVCCNRNDCKKIVKEEEVKILPQGGYTIKATGEHVNEEKVADSPDGEWHICREYVTGPGGYEPKGPVRCLMIPQGGF